MFPIFGSCLAVFVSVNALFREKKKEREQSLILLCLQTNGMFILSLSF